MKFIFNNRISISYMHIAFTVFVKDSVEIKVPWKDRHPIQ